MAGDVGTDVSILTAEQARQMWSLHGLPGHIGGSIPEYCSAADDLRGWAPICSCSWNPACVPPISNLAL